MALIDSTTAPLYVARLTALQTLSPEEMRATLTYLAGQESPAFGDALAHLAEFPAPTPEDAHRPRHSAAHRAEVAA